ncbi:MAG TPA: HlyD family secretion protein [Stellaceae bacterium]|nr:HlyD family secretion protein [Stellaceae bacterium]
MAMTNADAANGGGRSYRAPIVFLIIVIAVIIGGVWYYLKTAGTESTDDAYTDGRAITIAPKIAGYVTALDVNDNQRVKAGDVLLEIDPRDYTVARDKAAAALALAKAQLAAARATLEIAKTSYPAKLASAVAQRDSAKATLAKATADLERQRAVDTRATTQQQIDAAKASERNAAATLADNEAQVRIAMLVPENIANTEAQASQAEAQLAQAQTDLDQAELNLSYTMVVAPQDGWVTKRNVELGTYLPVGQSVFSLVSPEVWVTANFKESQLTHMRPGQSVKITVDAYPQLKLSGKVDSVQMGSGSRFSAFPAENATGNYVKIVQRVPVKIVIDHGLDPSFPLPIGLSVEPTVDLK